MTRTATALALVLLASVSFAARPPEEPVTTATHVQYLYDLKIQQCVEGSPSVSIEIPDGYYLLLDRMHLRGGSRNDSRVQLILDLMFNTTNDRGGQANMMEFYVPVTSSYYVPNGGYTQHRGTGTVELGLEVRDIIRVYAHQDVACDGLAQVRVMIVGWLVKE